MWVLLGFSVAALGPGSHLLTTTYKTWLCDSPTWFEDYGPDLFCFDNFYVYPTTGCRRNDSLCTSGQRVASSLSNMYISATCKEYYFEWTCADYAQQECGNLFCDAVANCNSDIDFCECPSPMIGDPVFERCKCPAGYRLSGKECIANRRIERRDVTVAPTAAPVPCFDATYEYDGALVIISFTAIAFCIGLCLGIFCGHTFCARAQRQPVNHREYGAIDNYIQ